MSNQNSAPLLDAELARAWCGDPDADGSLGAFREALQALATGRTVTISAERLAELERDADGMRSVIAQCSSIMHGQGVEDQGQAWDRVFDLLTQAAPVFTTGRELDSERLDWLEQKVVNVRKPALHGSFDLFWSKPPHPYDDADTDRSDLRARIDAARAKEATR